MCNKRFEIAWAKSRYDDTGEAPVCTDCDEPVKTATISFGQSMPEDEMRRAAALSKNCDLFLAIGSSLVVWPAAGFPLLAKKQRRKTGDHQHTSRRSRMNWPISSFAMTSAKRSGLSWQTDFWLSRRGEWGEVVARAGFIFC